MRLVVASSETRGQSSNSIVWQPPFGRRERGRERQSQGYAQPVTHCRGTQTYRQIYTEKTFRGKVYAQLCCPVTVNGSHHRARLLITETELNTGYRRHNLDSATRK